MINALLVVWRESFEAILIVGILFSYLSRKQEYQRTKKFLWGGVALGLGLSVAIGYAIQNIQTELEGRALDFFDSGLLLLAGLLMTQMCIWMKKHSRTIKSELETGLRDAIGGSKLIGISLLAALAIAREGAELVVFFYGMGLEAQAQGKYMPLIGACALGLVMSAFSAWAYFKGLKIFNARRFFQITSVFLLLTASSLILSAVRKLIQMEVLSPLKPTFWDTSFFLSDRSRAGQIATTLFGYEATPSLTVVLAAVAFWTVALFFYFEVPKFSKKAPIAKV